MEIDYNNSPRIRLVDSNDTLIKMVSHVEAGRLLRAALADVVYIETPTIRFLQPAEEWDERYIKRLPKSARECGGPFARKSVLYGNVRVQGPHGNEMFHCNSTKALWYINRGLAEIIDDNPPVVRLKFSPNGPGHIGDPYYLAEKVNRCVVCGCEEGLTRHHVLPFAYRRHLPDEIKSHNYHDVLLLCVPCHNKYEASALSLKRVIAAEFGLPANESHGLVRDSEGNRAANAARALLFYGKIPPDRREELGRRVREYLKRDFTTQDLEEIQALKCWNKSEEYIDRGKYVIDHLTDIQAFTVRWRQHFIDAMQPKFLPLYWDVNKLVVRDRPRSTRKKK